MSNKLNSLKVFVTSFVLMLAIMLPIIIQNRGYFIYSGDYNYQNIAFTAHTLDMVKSGKIFVDLSNSLGVDFFSSYSHIVFTPFYLFYLLFKTKKMAVLCIPVVTSLKTATATLMSYHYILRYVKNEKSAFIGSVLYAFSGFQMFSFIFGSFHDVTAWFPLLLMLFDQCLDDDKRGRFTFIVAFCAVNAFFFYGQVVFILLYFAVKIITGECRFTFRKILHLFIESVIGVMIAGVLLFPEVRTLMTNSRVSSYINGIDCVSYSDTSIVWRIVQSMFMMPDKASMTSLFSGENTWSSISLYLPCVGMIFVFSYIFRNPKKWDSVFLVTCLVFALVPVLNSTFFMFNSAYYARWFYMPVLIMSMVTSKEIEKFDLKSFKTGIKVSGSVMAVFALIALLPGKTKKLIDNTYEETISFMGFAPDGIYFWRMLGISGLFVLLIYIITDKYNDFESWTKRIITLTLAGTFVLGALYFNDVDGIDSEVSEKFYGSALTEPDLNDDGYYRINGQISNANLIWNVPGVDDFVTVVPDSLVEFYSQFDITRTQIAFTDSRYYPLNSLLSCKYYLNKSTGDDLNVEYSQFKASGFEKADVQPYYHIYENKEFIPVGFMYEYFIRESELEKFTEEFGKSHISNEKTDETEESQNGMLEILQNMTEPAEYSYNEKYLQKMLVMLRAVVLSDDCADNYKGILKELTSDNIGELNEETYLSDCEERKNMSCYDFTETKDGFEAKIKSDKENLVYFSVSYMDGWNAKVNGKNAEIIKVNYGFMAVKVDEGENDIVFTYRNDDYKTGLYLSLTGVFLYIVYIIVNLVSTKERKNGKNKKCQCS